MSVIDKIILYDEEFPYDEFEEIINNREQYIPILLEIVDDLYENFSDYFSIKDSLMIHLYSLFLLSEFRVKEAFPKIISLLKIDYKDLYELYDVFLIEDFPRMLVSTYNGDIDLLLNLVYDEEEDIDVRIMAICAISLIYQTKQINKDQITEIYKNIIYNVNTNKTLSRIITYYISDYHLFDMIDDVNYLYENNKIDDEESYGEVINAMYRYDSSKPQTFIEDSISEISQWIVFNNIKPRQKKEPSGFYHEHMKMVERLRKYLNQKIGRNEICPCGSGKKYKFCCINKDKKTEDIIDLLYFYPPTTREDPNQKCLSESYCQQAIEIDKLIFKALFPRNIPIDIPLNQYQEDIDRIHYLSEALDLAIYEIEDNGITSFQEYDKKYRIHYGLKTWIEELGQLISEYEYYNKNEIFDKLNIINKLKE